MATDPQLVLLDEPVAGMNEQESESVAKIVKKMQLEGNRTILLIEHDMKFVTKIWDSLPTHTRGGGHSIDGLFLTEKTNIQSFADTRKVTLKKY